MSFNDQGNCIFFDPSGGGNYQFATVTFALQRYGIKRIAMENRTEVVEYLSKNSVSSFRMHLKLFAGIP